MYMATVLPRMTRKRRWQYSCPMELTPRWYTHPEYSAARRPLPPLPLPRSGDPASESSTSDTSPGPAATGGAGGFAAAVVAISVAGVGGWIPTGGRAGG